jgi:hypothetical protein
VQQRRSSHTYRRCCLAVLIASTSTLLDSSFASANETRVPPLLRIPVERSGTDGQVISPLNSTLKIRVARRPWLLDKLNKPSHQPSVKMTPPRPPAAIPDPPSMSLVIPENGSGWVTRGRVKTQVPNYADLNVNLTPAEGTETSKNDSEPDQLTPKTKLQSVSPAPADPGKAQSPTRDPKAAASSPPVPEAMESAEAEAKMPTNAGKIKLEQKEKSSKKIQSTIGEKSTATLKGAAVIVGEGDESLASDTEIPSKEDKSDANQLVSPDRETSASGNQTAEPVADSSQADVEMADEVQPSAKGSLGSDSDLDGETGLQASGKKEAEVQSSSVIETKATSPETDTETTSGSDEPRNVDVVKVRKLRLQADGTVSDKSGLAESEAKSLKAEEDAKRASASQFVSSDNPRATKIDYTGIPAEPIKLTRSVSRMQNTIKQGLMYHYARPEASNERSNWGMLHSIMVFGADTKIRVNNRKHSAIAWIAGNNACRGQRLLTVKDDAIAARSGVGLQGHQAQCLAVFALCEVPLDYPVYAASQKFSIRELVESEMLACRSGEELTFSLIGLSHYLDTDTMWLNSAGETWSFERLIKEELSQPIVGSACGGTHRLMGFAHALRKRRAAGKPIIGQWKRAEIFMKDFEKYAYRLQNRDGSMSTDWFEGREDNGDVDRKIQTTGHMVEWLLTITPDEKLQETRLVNAVRYLANTIYSERGHDWKIGPKGHALRSLAMYYERVYGGDTAWQSRSVAKSGSKSRR